MRNTGPAFRHALATLTSVAAFCPRELPTSQLGAAFLLKVRANLAR
jgi:hypothetical protein